MHYVYILQSEANEKRFYTGLTDDLRKRLQSHNTGRVLYTAKWKTLALESLCRAFRPSSRCRVRALSEVSIRTCVRKEAPLTLNRWEHFRIPSRRYLTRRATQPDVISGRFRAVHMRAPVFQPVARIGIQNPISSVKLLMVPVSAFSLSATSNIHVPAGLLFKYWARAGAFTTS
jgi:predicted GIY-YIG superfamily endonuclease